MKDKIISAMSWVLFAFVIGMALHFGTNTAKIIWPSPPIEFKVEVSE
jgi:hypothetical protein